MGFRRPQPYPQQSPWHREDAVAGRHQQPHRLGSRGWSGVLLEHDDVGTSRAVEDASRPAQDSGFMTLDVDLPQPPPIHGELTQMSVGSRRPNRLLTSSRGNLTGSDRGGTTVVVRDAQRGDAAAVRESEFVHHDVGVTVELRGLANELGEVMLRLDGVYGALAM